jgi:hypothetical protein
VERGAGTHERREHDAESGGAAADVEHGEGERDSGEGVAEA